LPARPTAKFGPDRLKNGEIWGGFGMKRPLVSRRTVIYKCKNALAAILESDPIPRIACEAYCQVWAGSTQNWGDLGWIVHKRAICKLPDCNLKV
jgi:hypothetical protein